MLPILITIVLIGFAPLAAWSLRSYLIILGLLGLPLGWAWLDMIFKRADRGEDAWVDFFFVFAVTLPFVLSALGRGLGLLLQARGASRIGVLWTDALTIAAFAAVVFGPMLWTRFDARAPDQACVSHGAPVEIGERAFRLPYRGGVSLFPSTDQRRDARYLFLARHQRAVCAASANGARPITVLAVQIVVESIPCEPGPGSARRACVRVRDDSHRYGDDSSVVTIFTPEGMNLGAFAIGTRTYQQYRQRLAVAPLQSDGVLEAGWSDERNDYGFLFAQDRLTESGESLVALCRTTPDPGQLFCEHRQRLRGGVDLAFDFLAQRDQALSVFLERQDMAEALLLEIGAAGSGN